VRLAHYTIKAWGLKSWVVEGSLDGENWSLIDERTNRPGFVKWNKVSYSVSNLVEWRFVRLTQTDKKHNGNDALTLGAVEFFGTLVE
jgi:hypothetical protein